MKKVLIFILLLTTVQTQANTVRGEILLGIKRNHVSKFINSIWSDTKEVCDKYDLPMGMLIAQCCLESGHGRSRIAKELNNFLGIKSTKKVLNPKTGKMYRPYRKFKTRLDCFYYWAKIMQGKCYKKRPTNSLNSWLLMLETCGYHQSTTYSNKIRSIYFKYRLDKADKW